MFVRAVRQPLFIVALVLSSCAPASVAARTRSAPRNSFRPADDVAIGVQAAEEIRANIALIKDEQINGFVADMGRRLVDHLPDALRQPAFRYSFEILDQMYATTYALPGGPVFVTRGLLQAAASEQELAEQMARDISHIVLRHGTAQATAAGTFELGAISGADIGAVITGPHQSILTQGAGFGVTSYFLFYSDELEQEAVQLASQLVAGAGYDHPSQFPAAIQSRLRDLPQPAPTSPEMHAVGTVGRFGVVVPSGESRVVTAGDSLMLNVPASWRRVAAGNTVTFAPDEAFLKTTGGPFSVTHGVQIGVARSLTGSLQADMQALLEMLSRGGLNVRWRPSFQDTTLAGRHALTTALVNVSAATGAFEQVFVCTAHLPDGNLIYLIGLSPLDESGTYRLAFDRVRESIQPVP